MNIRPPSFAACVAAGCVLAATGAVPRPAPLLPLDAVSVPGAEGCTFCFEITDQQGVTQKACDTTRACASNEVCSGEGGVRNGRPWAKARCVPAAMPVQP